MKNIKSIEVIKEIYGLEVGDILTRKDGNSLFEIKEQMNYEDGGTMLRSISLSESMISKDYFKTIEWFENIETNKQKIARLENTVDSLRRELDTLQMNYDILEKNSMSLFYSVEKTIDIVSTEEAYYMNRAKHLEDLAKNDDGKNSAITSAIKEEHTVIANVLQFISKIRKAVK